MQLDEAVRAAAEAVPPYRGEIADVHRRWRRRRDRRRAGAAAGAVAAVVAIVVAVVVPRPADPPPPAAPSTPVQRLAVPDGGGWAEMLPDGTRRPLPVRGADSVNLLPDGGMVAMYDGEARLLRPDGSVLRRHGVPVEGTALVMNADAEILEVWGAEGLMLLRWDSPRFDWRVPGDRPGIDMVVDDVASMSGDRLVMVPSADRCAPQVVSAVNTMLVARLSLDGLRCTAVSGVWLSPDGATVAVHYAARRPAGETDRLALISVDTRAVRTDIALRRPDPSTPEGRTLWLAWQDNRSVFGCCSGPDQRVSVSID
jgi:hypothetical protein